MSTVCVDSGFLIGLYDESDQHHGLAEKHFSDFFDNDFNRLLVPWPVLYETLSTRMCRRRKCIAVLESDWRKLRARGQLVLLDDHEFREDAIDECLDEIHRPRERYRALSLVDRVLRSMLSEINLRIDVLITFNEGDFADVCARRGHVIVGR
jgi:predicted nucleic acid-binding protein